MAYTVLTPMEYETVIEPIAKFSPLDDSALRSSKRITGKRIKDGHAFEVFGPSIFFIVRVGKKSDPHWISRVFVMSNLLDILNFKMPTTMCICSADLIIFTRYGHAKARSRHISSIYQRKVPDENGVTHVVETQTGQLISFPWGHKVSFKSDDYLVALKFPPITFNKPA